MQYAPVTQVKVCGFTRKKDVESAVKAGVNYVGFVFYPPSSRNISADTAAELSFITPVGIIKVGLFVDPDNAFLDSVLDVVPLDMIQLHGAETPERVQQIKKRSGLPVMKAVAIENTADVEKLASFERVADQILCDAKPAKGELVPGGNGRQFDWSLLANYNWKKPWMLAGGLDVNTVAQAVRVTGARQVDVSSGVEYKKGLKNPDKIKAFIEAAQT